MRRATSDGALLPSVPLTRPNPVCGWPIRAWRGYSPRAGTSGVRLRCAPSPGDEAVAGLLRRRIAEHRHGNATTADFIALAQRISGMDLRHLFQVWLYDQKRPVSW